MGSGNAGLGGYPIDPQHFPKSPNWVSLEFWAQKTSPSPFIAFKFLILLCTHKGILLERYFFFFISTLFVYIASLLHLESHSTLWSFPHLGFYFVISFLLRFFWLCFSPITCVSIGKIWSPTWLIPLRGWFWVMSSCLGAGKIRMPRNRDFPCSPLFFSLSCSLDRTEDCPFDYMFSFLLTWSL